MISSEMRIARADLANRAAPTRRYLDYVQEHGFNILEIAGFAGVVAVTRPSFGSMAGFSTSLTSTIPTASTAL